MIFKQMDKVKDGSKTQTRRVVKDGERYSVITIERVGEHVGSKHEIIYPSIAQPVSGIHTVYTAKGARKWVVGRNYPASPKMYQPAFGRFAILSLAVERLHDIDEEDAIAEGVASVAEYIDLWQFINEKNKGFRWQDNPLVHVIEYKYLGDVLP